MAKGTFHKICVWLTCPPRPPRLRRQDTGMQPALPVEKHLAIAIWKLATLDSYCSMGQQFGLGKSTVGAIVQEVMRAINVVLMQWLIHLGDVNTAMVKLGFPHCFGALDGTHIPMRALAWLDSQYIHCMGAT